MHRRGGPARQLHVGFDAARLYLRLDFSTPQPPGEDTDLTLEFVEPRPFVVRVHGLARGDRKVSGGPGPVSGAGPASAAPLAGAACRIGSILELAVPFASVNLSAGDQVELVLHLGAPGEPGETLPPEDLVRLSVPGPGYAEEMWSV